MKNKIVSIVDQCTNDKEHNDFCLLLTLNSYLRDDKTEYIDYSLFASDRVSEHIMLSLSHEGHNIAITFYADKHIGITLPFSGLFLIPNSTYNLQYEQIKEMISNAK